MKLNFWVGQLALIMLLSGCGAPPASSQTDDREIDDLVVNPVLCPTAPAPIAGEQRFCGVLNSQAVAAIKDLVASGAKRLVVTSPGGGEDYAIEISRLVEAAGVQLVFEKFCLSACASFLFLPADSPEVKAGTLIAFNHTSLALASLRARSDAPDGERFRKSVLETINRETAFYESRGLPLAWLVEPLIRMGPTCILKQLEWTNPDYPFVAFSAEFKYWIPSREMLDKRGRGSFVGFWPDAPAEAQALIDSVGRELQITKIAWKGSGNFTPDVLWLGQLPFCPE